MKNISKKFFFIVLVCLVSFTCAHISYAANLYIAPASASYSVGKTFNVQVRVSSLDQAMNAVSGKLTYPTNRLQIISISKEGSVISLWPEEPSFSNAGGTVQFQGIVPNPGFTGNGAVLTIAFRSLSEGTAEIAFAAGAVLANDGNGTDITSSLGNSSITINAAPAIVAPEPQSVVPKKITTIKPSVSTTTPIIATSTGATVIPTVISSTTSQPETQPQSAPSNVTHLEYLIALLILLVLAMWLHSYYRLRRLEAIISRNLKENHVMIHSTFTLLRNDLAELTKGRIVRGNVNVE